MKQVHLFIIGVGNVGGELINQILFQRNFLKDNFDLDIHINAMSDSKDMWFVSSQEELFDWKSKMHKDKNTTNISEFIDYAVKSDFEHKIFVDNTASKDISDIYEPFLENGIAVVTCNKIAASESYERYLNLRHLARENKTKFLYETNVGAALPIISTIDKMIKTGDKINKIQAVLSGSLNFIFNNLDGSKKFADIVREAKSAGYTEPDPRIDLKGLDVLRKILILVRESGYKISAEDVQVNNFLDQKYFEVETVSEFIGLLEQNESDFVQMRLDAEDKGAKLKYVAEFDGNKTIIGLQEVYPDSPLFNVNGKDNIALIFSERYPDFPVVVKGAGAGPEVTASGVFSDILAVCNR